MTIPLPDIIDLLAGIEPGSHLDKIRNGRPEARKNAQSSYRALFETDELDAVSEVERFALATFVGGLHREKVATDFYASGLRQRGGKEIVAAITGEIAHAETSGPYGGYPSGPLSVEDKAGLVFSVSAPGRQILGEKLSTAFEHAHLLVFHPRDATPRGLKKLLDAGWSATGIVTLSQLTSFLAFQVRVIAGLRALLAAPRKDVTSDEGLLLATAAAATGHL